jgi:tetratricopeptide (TPR) repeat protein
MRRWLVTFFVLVLVPWTVPLTSLQAQDVAARRDSARLNIDAALTLVAAGDTVAALAELKKATAVAPDLAEAHFQYGRLLAVQAGSDTLSPERHAAEGALLKAVALDPDNSLYLSTLVRLSGERHMTAEGKRVVDDLLRPGRATRLLDPDSMVLVDTARAWVRHFESLRARSFPRRTARYRCDEAIGETCLAYVDVNSSRPQEPAVVESARRALLEKLAVASESLHGDQFITSQRVRYLVEAGRLRDALAIARSCGLSTRWWCEALTGYVLHEMEDFDFADSAFALALQNMPVQGRRWSTWRATSSAGCRVRRPRGTVWAAARRSGRSSSGTDGPWGGWLVERPETTSTFRPFTPDTADNFCRVRISLSIPVRSDPANGRSAR